MSNRKRVTLTFEIDDHDGFNDEAFLRHDFLQELRCCVNDPCEDTFAMKVEDADTPQEMSAVEWLMITSEICARHRCSQCPFYDVPCIGEYVDSAFTVDEAKEAVAIVEKWAREHPEK